MLAAKAIEAKIVSAIRDALAARTEPHEVTGFWQTTAYGVLKSMETRTDLVALVEVSTSSATQSAFSSPDSSFDASVRLAVRLDLDPQGEAFAAFAEALDALFRGWMRLTYQQTFTALDVDGYSVDGLGIAGSLPELDAEAKVASASWTLDFAGTFRETSTQTPMEV